MKLTTVPYSGPNYCAWPPNHKEYCPRRAEHLCIAEHDNGETHCQHLCAHHAQAWQLAAAIQTAITEERP